MNNTLGVIIKKIYPSSPAEDSGLHTGNNKFFIDDSYLNLDADIITKIDDTIISDARQYNTLISNKRIGENLSLSILRDEQIKIINITVGSTTNYIFENASVYAHPDNVNFIKYEDMQAKIKLQKPINWNLEKDENESKIIFRAPYENLNDTTREYFKISYDNLPYSDINQAAEVILPSSTFLVTHPEEITEIHNNTAKKVHYSYKSSNRGDIEGIKIAIEKNGKYYIIDFRAQTQKFDKYLPTVSKMIESFEILELNSFEDFDQGIRLNYLPDWNVSKEKTYSNATYTEGDNIIFSPIEKSNSIHFKNNLEVFVSEPYQDNSIAIEDYNDTINYFKSLNYPNFKLIESKSTTLKNIQQPMYNVTYSYGDFNFGKIISSNLITVQNDRLYIISYSVSKKNTTNIPTISAIIDSIELFNLQYYSNPDLGITFKYPSNMDISEDYKKITLSFPKDYYDFISPTTLTFEVYNSTTPNNNLNVDIYSAEEKNYSKIYLNTTFEEPINANKTTFKEIDNSNYMISGDSRNEFQQMQIISLFKNKKDNNNYTYTITYSGKSDRYIQYNSTVKNIIDSLKIIDYLPLPKDFTLYNSADSSFNIRYPSDWLPPVSYGNDYTEFKPNMSHIKEVYYKDFNNNEENKSIDYPNYDRYLDPTISISSIPFEKGNLFSFIQDNLGIIAQDSNFELIESNDISTEKIASYQIKYFIEDQMIMDNYILNKENPNNINIISYKYTWPEFYNFLPIVDEIIPSFNFNALSKTIINKFNGFKVGKQPFGLAVNSLTNILYVANSLSNTISVINGSNDKVIENIDVSNNPSLVAVNQIRNLVYVTHPNSLSIIDGNNNTLIDKISISIKDPISVSVNEVAGIIYVADGISKNVSVIDTNNNKEIYVIDTIDKLFEKTKYTGSGVTFDPFKNRVYIVNDVNSSIFVINGENNRIIEVIPIKDDEHPYDVTVNSLTGKIYIIGHIIIDNDDSGSFVSEISLSDHKEKVLGVDYQSQFNFITLHQLTNTIYLTDPISNQIKYIDLSNGDNDIIPINVDTSPLAVAINQDTNTIYVTNYNSNTVSKIDGYSRGVKYGLTFDINPSDSIYISCKENNNNIRQFSDNDYISYTYGTSLKCNANSKNIFSPLIYSTWHGIDKDPPIEFVVTEYGIVGGTFVDLASLLQKFGPFISIFILAFVVITASIPSLYSKFRKIADIVKEELLSKTEIITIDASVMVGVLFFLTISEGFEISEQTQITIVTANIIFPFAISAILAIINHEKFATRLMIAGFINLMISVILIAIMRM